MMITPSELRRMLDWVDAISHWEDATLDEFLQEIYGSNMAQGYIDEKREKLKRSIADWYYHLDGANRERFTTLISNQSPDKWWQTYKEKA